HRRPPRHRARHDRRPGRGQPQCRLPRRHHRRLHRRLRRGRAQPLHPPAAQSGRTQAGADPTGAGHAAGRPGDDVRVRPTGGRPAGLAHRLAARHAGQQRAAAGPVARRHDGLRHGRAGQQGRLCVLHRPDRQPGLHPDGRRHGGRHDPAAGHRAGHLGVPQPLHRRRARLGHGRRRARAGLRHRRGDSVCRARPAAHHPGAGDRLGRGRRDLDDRRRRVEGTARRHLRAADPQRGDPPAQLRAGPGGRRGGHRGGTAPAQEAGGRRGCL
ncbi:hypothetical protein XPN_1498, partial [Xanthomonas arboricola pv. pruni MAFF 301427]